MNLSPEKDYNGNVNPIREVLPKEKINTNTATTTKDSNNNFSSKEDNNKKQNKLKNVGAKMAEGDFNSPSYKANKQSNNNNFKNNTLQNTEYINKIAKDTTNKDNNIDKKPGDSNESEK